MTFQKGHKPLGRALKGHITTEETKQKIMKKAIERYESGFNPLKGIKFTEDHKMKLKENHADVSGKNNPMYGKKPGRLNQYGENNPYWKGGVSYRRKDILKKFPNKCNRCSISDPKVLLIHHKDRNRKNNKIENIEILCRNCHILEHWEEHRLACIRSKDGRKTKCRGQIVRV